MARTNLKTMSVYTSQQERAVIKKAAAAKNMSVSAFLLFNGLKRAEQSGIHVPAALWDSGPLARKPTRRRLKK